MVNLLIKHKVNEYEVWKKVFDGFIETRRASGEKNWRIWHLHDNPNDLVLLFEWDSHENARSFMNNPELKQAMVDAGVSEPPEFYFLEENDRGRV